MTLDTACSSSMYALHQACQAIHSGDCAAAIVAGSNLILTPECQIFSSALGAVSPTSRCHTFDSCADGYARADGIGALYVKRLSDAVRDHDPIRAVIRATAINANGKTGGITRPSTEGQESAIRAAYNRAIGISYASTGYFECHGTGTPVGDPLEVAAIRRVFGDHTAANKPMLIGSIKTNLGHSEPVSGIAGIMKTVLSLEHGVIPATVGVKNIHPALELGNGIEITTQNSPWPDRSSHIASINSFGYGGANAHTILESADSFFHGFSSSASALRQLRSPSVSGSTDENDSTYSSTDNDGMDLDRGYMDKPKRSLERPLLFMLSAHNTDTLKANAEALACTCNEYSIEDLAYTLNARRSKLAEKAFLVSTAQNLQNKLRAQDLAIRRTSTHEAPRVGFAFTGQGAQWRGMGLEVDLQFPRFRTSLQMQDKYLSLLEQPPLWKLEDLLMDTNGLYDINKPEVSQTLTTALQVALVDLLRSWSIVPVATVGHSSGEIAAVYAAGLVNAQQAIQTAYLRGKAVQRNRKEGLMLAVGLGADELLRDFDLSGDVGIACFNSMSSVTVSGAASDIRMLKAALDSNKVFARLLSTGGNAYHSHHMVEVGAEYERMLSEVFDEPSSTSWAAPAAIAFISSVTGNVSQSEPLEPGYWKSNLESPVRFHHAIQNLVSKHPVDILVELGPHSALRSSIEDIAKAQTRESGPEYLASLTRDHDSAEDLLHLAGNLAIRGSFIDLHTVNGLDSGEDCHTVNRTGTVLSNLPRYQWCYNQPLYRENRWTQEWRLRQHPRHDLLGSRVPGSPQIAPSWRNILRLKDVPWLADHRVNQEIVLPAAGHICMVVEALQQTLEIDGYSPDQIHGFQLTDVQFSSALTIPAVDQGTEITLTLFPSRSLEATKSSQVYNFIVCSSDLSLQSDNSVERSSGTIRTLIQAEGFAAPSSHLMHSMGHTRRISLQRWWHRFRDLGLAFGPAFQIVQGLHATKTSVNATIQPPAHDPMASDYVIYLTTVDGGFQMGIIGSHRGLPADISAAFVPTAIKKLVLNRASANDRKASCVESSGTLYKPNALQASFVITKASGLCVAQAHGILYVALPNRVSEANNMPEPYSRMRWVPDFDRLDTHAAARLKPPLAVSGRAILHELDQLALYQIMYFHQFNPEIFRKSSDVPHLARILEWMAGKVQQAHQGRLFRLDTLEGTSREEQDKAINLLASSLISKTSEAALSCHIFANLGAIFSGNKTGIQVALEDDRLSKMYEDGQRVREGNLRLATVLSMLAQNDPRLHILEVGGGTGSATREILRELQGSSIHRKYDRFVFTDITPSFLKGAEEQFQSYHGLEYSVFDMECEAHAAQHAGKYNVVVASNTVHASSNIRATLRNLHKVLRKGGKLILLEITEAPLAAGLLIGTYSDYWKGDQDAHFPRHDGPFLSKDMWVEALAQAGFNGLDFYLDDYAEISSTSVLVATASDDQPLQPIQALQGMTIVHRAGLSEWSFVQCAAAHYEALGLAVDVLSLDQVESFKHGHVLALVEIEDSLFETVTCAEWQALQSLFAEASSLLWVSNGATLSGEDARHALISGLALGLWTETPAQRLWIMDLDTREGTITSQVLPSLFNVHEELLLHPEKPNGLEFRQKDGITYVARLQPDSYLNDSGAVAKAEARLIEDLDYERRKDVGHQSEQSLAFKGADNSDNFQEQFHPSPAVLGGDTIDLGSVTWFDPDASYLLVGCLSGVGKIIAEWMLYRGARHLLFLSRSGDDREESRMLAAKLNAQGATVEIVKGHVENSKDVDRAVAHCHSPIRGVVQAALVLEVTIQFRHLMAGD